MTSEARQRGSGSTQGLPEVLLHQIAQSMVFAKHGDWRYDPGDPKYDKWFERAKQFASAAHIGYERIGNGDGRGSIPSRPDDRPESHSVRLVGTWLMEKPNA